jgi:transcriptional regulator with XRE-family HTH domain
MSFCPVFWTKDGRKHGKFKPVKQRSFIFVGRLVSRLRSQRKWTQPDFAVELQFAGWHEASRDTVAKLEGGLLRVDLIQVRYLARALRVSITQFLSEIDWNKIDFSFDKNRNQ